MLWVSGTVVWVLPWVSHTPGACHPVEPSPDSTCFTILLGTNCVFPTVAWMGAPGGRVPLTHCGRGHRSPPTRVLARQGAAEAHVPRYACGCPMTWRGSPAWTLQLKLNGECKKNI